MIEIWFLMIRAEVLPEVQVEKLRDDIIQLKILQTALSLMQSRVLAESEVHFGHRSLCQSSHARSTDLVGTY